MHVPVGAVFYAISLPRTPILVAGGAAWACCDPARQVIMVSGRLPVARRWSLLWHELAHAWQFGGSKGDAAHS
jgi:hypothetical protein